MQDILNHHNRPLYVTSSVSDDKLRRALVDPRSFLNIILLYVLEVADVSRDKITKQPIEVADFEGNSTYTLGFINFDLTVRPIRTTNRHMSLTLALHIICF